MACHKDHGIKHADTNPAFEYWLLLHYEETLRPFENCGEITKRIKKSHWPAYKKAASVPDELLEKIPDAMKRAERCRKHHKDCKGDGNPSTNVDQLVRSLNTVADESIRFKLRKAKS